MNKTIKIFYLLLTFSLVVISTTPLIQAMSVVSNPDKIAKLGEKIPLSNEEIESRWPNLPTAKQLYENGGGLVIDLRYCGKQVASMNESLPDPKSPTVYDVTSIIENCTTTSVDYHLGGLNVNTQRVWLQYNSSIWIQVPKSYFQQTTSAKTITLTSNWALGMYANPQEIAGTYDVLGVCTFGEWNSLTFGSGDDAVGTCVLSVCSEIVGYQFVMELQPTGRYVTYNIWDLANPDEPLFDGSWEITDAVTGQLYNMYIRYTPGSGWQGWWNQTLFWTCTVDTCHYVRPGNQPFVVVESNDFTQGDFIGFSTDFGGYQYGYNLCAAVYLHDGYWEPINSGDYSPAGYTYIGGQYVNGIQIGSYPPPSYWTSRMGETSNYRGRFTVGIGLPERAHGYNLWTYGTI